MLQNSLSADTKNFVSTFRVHVCIKMHIICKSKECVSESVIANDGWLSMATSLHRVVFVFVTVINCRINHSHSVRYQYYCCCLVYCWKTVLEAFCIWVCPSVSEWANEFVHLENIVNTISLKPVKEFHPIIVTDVPGFIDVLFRFRDEMVKSQGHSRQ